MVTSIEELKQQSRKEVTAESGRVFQIHKLSQIDFSRAQIVPVIPVEDQKEEPQSPSILKRTLDNVQYVLEKGARIFFGEESKTPEGSICADWIAGDEGFLFEEIMKFSGLDQESRQKLEDLTKNEHGSETSTKSVEASESSPASS